MKTSLRTCLVFLLVLGAALQRAEAAFNQMLIVEIYPGSYADPDAQYVVLQSTAPGQNSLATHEIFTFDEAGNPGPNFGVFASDSANGAQGTHYLMATAHAKTLFGFAQVDGTATGRLPFPSGRICFAQFLGVFVDCVAYGSFTGNNGTYGPPAPALARQRALQRVATTHNNSVDFALGAPGPINSFGESPADTDGDGIPDVSDCAPGNSSLYLHPLETQNMTVSYTDDGTGKFTTTVTWDDETLLVGGPTVYDVVYQDLVSPANPRPYTTAACLDFVISAPSVIDPDPDPAPGHVRLYLSRATNACGDGTYGDSTLTPDPRDTLDNPATTPCF